MKRQIERNGKRVNLALALDLDDDDRVTLAEFRTAATGIFRAADENGDGYVSKDEATSFHNNPREPAEGSQPVIERPAPG